MENLNDWLTTTEAARLTGYNIQYIRRLVRSNKVESKKWGRDWMISRASLLAYRTEDQRRGPRQKRGTVT
jgi:excisionase family DNA binding protein